MPNTAPAVPPTTTLIRYCSCGCGAVIAGIHDQPGRPAEESPLYTLEYGPWTRVDGPVALSRCRRERSPTDTPAVPPEREAVPTMTLTDREAALIAEITVYLRAHTYDGWAYQLLELGQQLVSERATTARLRAELREAHRIKQSLCWPDGDSRRHYGIDPLEGD